MKIAERVPSSDDAIKISIAAERIEAALNIAFERGQCDGGHHKMRVIDDMVRALTGDQYNTWVEAYTEGGEWEWDTGI